MTYTIENKSDLSGAMLVIRFPEQDLDKKAVCTIEHDPPAFLIPFSRCSVNGMVECTYHLGNCSKLQYRFGSHTVPDYIHFWMQVLQPLLDCDDWFLKPFSFVLDYRYLYVDRNNSVSYLYVPSLQDCSSFDALQAMVNELSQQNSVTDVMLENKVLRAMQDFKPKSFLAMLRTMEGTAIKAEVSEPEKKSNWTPPAMYPEAPAPSAPVPQPAPQMPAPNDDEIHINLGGNVSPQAKKSKSLFGRKKKEKPEKAEKAGKKHKPFFGKKEQEQEKEIVLGAAADSSESVFPRNPADEPLKPDVLTVTVLSDKANDDPESNKTQFGGPRLELVGSPSLPRSIPVNIPIGRVFTIGRFDVKVGQPQSTFEFAAETKAVSRRHAAIEHTEDGYFVVDLASKAGTFVDGEKLIPNVPHSIVSSTRISFGTSGADYIWVEGF